MIRVIQNSYGDLNAFGSAILSRKNAEPMTCRFLSIFTITSALSSVMRRHYRAVESGRILVEAKRGKAVPMGASQFERYCPSLQPACLRSYLFARVKIRFEKPALQYINEKTGLFRTSGFEKNSDTHQRENTA
jgi:hypothetical protein